MLKQVLLVLKSWFLTRSFEAIVFATGMDSVTTLTFSGDAVTTPSIMGLAPNNLTVNAIYDNPAPDTYNLTANGALIVNLNVDPAIGSSISR